MFKYVLRKFLLANRVGAAQEAGKPSDVAAWIQKGVECALVLPLPACPYSALWFWTFAPQALSLVCFFSSLWASQSQILSVCYLVSVPVFLCLCLSLILAFLLLALSSWFLLGAEPEGAKSSVGKEVEVGSGQKFLMVSQVDVNLSPPTISLLGSPWDWMRFIQAPFLFSYCEPGSEFEVSSPKACSNLGQAPHTEVLLYILQVYTGCPEWARLGPNAVDKASSRSLQPNGRGRGLIREWPSRGSPQRWC